MKTDINKYNFLWINDCFYYIAIKHKTKTHFIPKKYPKLQSNHSSHISSSFGYIHQHLKRNQNIFMLSSDVNAARCDSNKDSNKERRAQGIWKLLNYLQPHDIHWYGLPYTPVAPPGYPLGAGYPG